MYQKLTPEETLAIEERMLRDMAARYGKQLARAERERWETWAAAVVPIAVTVDGPAPYLIPGAVYDAKPGRDRDGLPVFWVFYNGHMERVRAEECVRLDEPDERKEAEPIVTASESGAGVLGAGLRFLPE